MYVHAYLSDTMTSFSTSFNVRNITKLYCQLRMCKVKYVIIHKTTYPLTCSASAGKTLRSELKSNLLPTSNNCTSSDPTNCIHIFYICTSTYCHIVIQNLYHMYIHTYIILQCQISIICTYVYNDIHYPFLSLFHIGIGILTTPYGDWYASVVKAACLYKQTIQLAGFLYLQLIMVTATNNAYKPASLP